MMVKIGFGKKQFAVTVEKANVKSVAITVHPDLKITAKAPVNSDDETIEKRIKKRAFWIAKQIQYFESFHPLARPREYVSGETHYYLGRQYRLKIVESDQCAVKLNGKYFFMELTDIHDKEKAKQAMQVWYRRYAEKTFNKRINNYLSYFSKKSIKRPIFHFRAMKKRWGSFSKSGIITLNVDLIKAPIHCIDYVIVHELCHLIHSKHDAKFFRLLEKTYPGWERSKERLEHCCVV